MTLDNKLIHEIDHQMKMLTYEMNAWNLGDSGEGYEHWKKEANHSIQMEYQNEVSESIDLQEAEDLKGKQFFVIGFIKCNEIQNGLTFQYKVREYFLIT